MPLIRLPVGDYTQGESIQPVLIAGFEVDARVGSRSRLSRCLWLATTPSSASLRRNNGMSKVDLSLGRSLKSFNGQCVSLRKIVDHLNQFEQVRVSHVALLKWIQKYVEVMCDYVNAMKPELSRVFHADETKVNIRGQSVWLWHLMDGDTRFLSANHVSKSRNLSDAREAFREAKEVAKVEPRVLLTDGLGSYSHAAQCKFQAVHVAGVGLQGRLNNNRIERYH